MFDAVSQFITKFWGVDEDDSKSNQLDNIEVFEIDDEDGIYNFIDERWIESHKKNLKRENSSEDTRI